VEVLVAGLERRRGEAADGAALPRRLTVEGQLGGGQHAHLHRRRRGALVALVRVLLVFLVFFARFAQQSDGTEQQTQQQQSSHGASPQAASDQLRDPIDDDR